MSMATAGGKSGEKEARMGVRFGRVEVMDEEKEMRVEVGMDVNESAREAWTRRSALFNEQKRIAIVIVCLFMLVLKFIVSGTNQTIYTPKGIEWSRHWNLESELGIATVRASAILAPFRIRKSLVVRDRGLPIKIILVDRRQDNISSIDKNKDDVLAPETADSRLIVRASVFENRYAILLNKFPIYPGHALLVTRSQNQKKKIAQNTVLSKKDLDALHRCAFAAHGVAFYNSHKEAGSSQSHRHFQFVPMASIDSKGLPPIYTALQALEPEVWRWSSRAPFVPVVRRLPALADFHHGIVRLPDRTTYQIDFNQAGSTTFADALLRAYLAIATRIGLLKQKHDDILFDQTESFVNSHPSLLIHAPYNLILTTDFILIVRRSKASAQVHIPSNNTSNSFFADNAAAAAASSVSAHNASWSVPLNGLAFAGSIVLNNLALFDLLAASSSTTSPTQKFVVSPIDLLKDVSLAAATSDR